MAFVQPRIRDDQSSSYRLPMGDNISDTFLVIKDSISSLSSEMRSKKVSKLLPYPGVRSSWYYHIEGEKVIWHQTLLWAITEVGEDESPMRI